MTAVFRDFQRTTSPLSGYLAQQYTTPALADIDVMSLVDLADPEATVERLLAAYWVAPPTLGEGRATGTSSGEYRPNEAGTVRAPTVRHWVRYLVEGDIEALRWWPDDAGHDADTGSDLVAVDDGVSFADRSREVAGGPGADLQDYLARLESQRWQVAGDNDPQRSRGLYTFVEHLEADLDRAALGELHLDLGGELAAHLARVQPIIVAIAEQHRRFFETDLPALLSDAVARRRQRLRGLQAARDSIGFPADWKDPEPQLAEDQPLPEAAGGTDLALPSGTPPRFADASFEQVLRTVRVWANAVEQHPEAYRQLDEDRISDLLVVTLNAALPGANREVYSRGGKTDIFIKADALPTGAGPEKVFIGENKKYSGPAAASTALDQLMGYLQVQDTKALLLLLVERSDFQRAQRSVTAALRGRPDFIDEGETPVEGWPLRLRPRRWCTGSSLVSGVAS